MAFDLRLWALVAAAAMVGAAKIGPVSLQHQKVIDSVIVGDPNHPSNDVLGAPITKEEMRASLSSVSATDLPPKVDPIASSGYFQGDIMVPSKDVIIQILKGDPEGQLSAIKNHRMTWPSGVIPYVISSSFTSQERAVVARAMAEFASHTCIRFVPRAAHTDYVHILRGQGCSSAVGRNGGTQVLSLGNGCVHLGVVLHELMHAAGFWHEQSRYDRDNFVSINWDNIIPGLQYNFDKKSNAITTDLGLPYDYASIMHYGAYAFARSYSTPTIVPRQSGVTIGQRKGFSELDIKGLRALYQCEGGPTTCTDKNQHCESWAGQGYCTSNPAYMKLHCPAACDLCGSGSCVDLKGHCSSWAQRGECQRNQGYMGKNCRRACGLCGEPSSCKDLNQFCADWAGKGECGRNPGYMSVNCKKSCSLC